jgi:GntR family transcriptional regulator / MocR family aminotransferase
LSGRYDWQDHISQNILDHFRMPKDAASLELALHPRPRGTTLTRWLYEELRGAILDGRLRAGARLPATRDFSRHYGVSRGTVVTIFEQLESTGYLRSRVGAGTWVSALLPRATRREKRSPLAQSARPGPLVGLSFPPPARPFRLHEPAVQDFPLKVWARVASRRMRRLSPSLLVGSYPGGYEPLRIAIADYLASVRGVRCDADQIAITSGVQQSLDILARLLLKPGDAVWMEDPGYFGATMAFQNAGAKIVPVPVDTQGLVVARGQKASPHAKCAYVTPAHQFPLGAAMSGQRRLKLLAWATEAGAFIIEDDYDSEYRFEGLPVPALQGVDRSGRVILLGTFNKLLFPTIRLGYAVLPASLVDRFHAFRFGTDLNGTGLQQAVLCDFMTEGHLGRHIRKTRELYGARLAALQDGGKKYLGGLLDISDVRAGLYTTGLLRNGMTSQAGEAAALARDIETMGLHRFTLGRRDHCGFLLGFAAFEEKRIHDSLRTLAAALEPGRTRGKASVACVMKRRQR